MAQKKLIILLGSAVGALVGFSLLFTWIVSAGFETSDKLKLAMRLLNDGRWDVAGRIARDLDEAGNIDLDTNSPWHYVQGVSKVLAVSDDLDSPRNRRVLLEAIEHLEKSDELGFPLGYAAKGKFTLGWCYFNTYRWADAVKALDGIPQRWPERRSDAFQMAVQSLFRQDPADFDAAERLLLQWTKIPGLSPGELARVELTNAQLNFYKGDYKDCESHLVAIEEESPEHLSGLLWRARWRLSEAANHQQESPLRANLLGEADEQLSGLLLSADTPRDLQRQADFLYGRLLRMEDKKREATGTFSSIRQRSPQSSEAIASSLEEAELLLEQDQKNECIDLCQVLLRNVEDLALYNGYWITEPELRERLMQLGRTLRDAGDYGLVIRLSEYIAQSFPLADSIRLQAEAFAHWADRMMEATPAATPDALAKQRGQAERTYESAANKYEELAKLEIKSADYPDVLWQAIVNYQRADDLASANRLLKEYLRYEQKAKTPRGYLALGKNYMNSGQWQSAIGPLERCLEEHRGHGILYEVRLLAAKAHAETGNLDQAAERLFQNLYDFGLKPRSEIWDDSMFTLGQVLYRRGHRLILELDTKKPFDAKVRKDLEESQQHFVDAVDRLGLAVSRLEDDPRYYPARYTIAKSHRLAAKTYKILAESNLTLLDSLRRKRLQKWRGLLNQALVEFRDLREEIVLADDARVLTTTHQDLVRNCYFGEADALYDLGRWDEAVTAYRDAASRYMNRPESLEALVQMAQCYRQMGNQNEAITTLAQAEQVLTRIPLDQDPQFALLTRTDRAGWEDLLAWLKQWN